MNCVLFKQQLVYYFSKVHPKSRSQQVKEKFGMYVFKYNAKKANAAIDKKTKATFMQAH